MRYDLTDKMSLKEKFGHVRNLLSCLYQIDRTYFFLATVRLLLDAVKSALIIVLSADILGLLYVSEIGRAHV